VVTRGRTVTLAALVAIALVAAMFVRGFVLPQPEEPLTDGPVLVLGGSPGRVDVATRLLPEPSADRPLVLSHHAADQYEAMGGSCETTHVRCIRPQPVSTWGEAQAAAAMAQGEGWPAVTVVTDDFHLPRSRLLMRRCLDVPVRLVGTGGGRVPIGLAVREAAATLVSAVGYHDC
jgi:hypothetical protein